MGPLPGMVLEGRGGFAPKPHPRATGAHAQLFRATRPHGLIRHGGGATASGEKNGTRSVPIGGGGGTAAATHRSGGFRTFRKRGRERALPSTVLAAFPFCLPGIAAHLRMFGKMPFSFPCPYDEAHVAAQGHLTGMLFAAHLFQSRILMKTCPDCVSVLLWHFKDERLFSEHTGVAGVHPETA